jgi:hypothetical protein
VAVFEMNALRRAAIAPKAMTTAYVELETPGSESTRKANLRSSPWVIIAWAMMNAPMNKKIVSDEKAP